MVSRNNSNLTEAQVEQLILDNFNAITGFNYTSYSDVETYFLGENGEKIYEYYEYYQFKKAVFKCTGITYDDVLGRVSSISFEFTGEIE